MKTGIIDLSLSCASLVKSSMYFLSGWFPSCASKFVILRIVGKFFAISTIWSRSTRSRLTRILWIYLTSTLFKSISSAGKTGYLEVTARVEKSGAIWTLLTAYLRSTLWLLSEHPIASILCYNIFLSISSTATSLLIFFLKSTYEIFSSYPDEEAHTTL